MGKIMDALNQGRQYLLLHSVKELLQHSDAEHEVKPYAQTLWQNIINTGQAEDNKVVSAECVGRLAIIDPASYLPQLQTFWQNPNATIRGMVIAALRYVFSGTNETYDDHLRNSIIQMLAEQQKAVVKVAVAYTKAFVGEETRGWRDFFEWVRKDFTQLVKASEEELKSG